MNRNQKNLCSWITEFIWYSLYFPHCHQWQCYQTFCHCITKIAVISTFNNIFCSVFLQSFPLLTLTRFFPLQIPKPASRFRFCYGSISIIALNSVPLFNGRKINQNLHSFSVESQLISWRKKLSAFRGCW